MTYSTTDLTRQLLTAACGLADQPGEPASAVLRAVADDAAEAATSADVFQRVAIAAAMSLEFASQHSGIPRDELLAEVLRRVSGDESAP